MKYTLKIGKRIKALRKMKGLSQEKLAEIIHCNYKTISNLENDKYTPDLKQIINICDVLDISLDSLFSLSLPKNDHFIMPDHRNDGYPAFIKRIPLDPQFSLQHITDLEYISQKLPLLTSQQIHALHQLIDLW